MLLRRHQCDDYYGPQGFRLIYDYLSTMPTGTNTPGPWWDSCWAIRSVPTAVSAGASALPTSRGNLVSVTERTCIEPYEGGIHYTEDGGATWQDLPANTVYR